MLTSAVGPGQTGLGSPSEQPELQRERHGARPVRNTELLEHVDEVCLHRGLTDEKFSSDRGVAVAKCL